MFDFVSKLQYYPEKINSFINGEYEHTLSTVLLYLSSGICNQDCYYCDKNFYSITPKSFEKSFLDKLVDDMVELGANSMIILGEGSEPLLNPNLCSLIDNATAHNIECGIYTNGSIVNEQIINSFNKLDFLRLSLDAGSKETHIRIHKYNTNKDYYESAIKMLKALDKKKVNTGVAYIILKENVDELYDAWELMSDIGVGFIEIKFPLKEGYVFDEIDEKMIQSLKNQLSRIENSGRKGAQIVLNNHIKRLFCGDGIEIKDLTRQDECQCFTCAFRTIVSPLGFFNCSPKKNLEDSRYGDPFCSTLYEAWNSDRHKSMIGKNCSICCTYYQQNQVLSDIRNGNMHIKDALIDSGQKYFL